MAASLSNSLAVVVCLLDCFGSSLEAIHEEIMKKPLAGIRVLELGQLIAGPFAAKMLGEFGAEVIKVEPPVKGDPLRIWRLIREGTSVWWQVQSRTKKSITLDLRKAEAPEVGRKIFSEGRR